METDIRIDAVELTKVATHLRTTLYEFSKSVERFDNTAAALMQQNETHLSRFETAVADLNGAIDRQEQYRRNQ